MGERLTAASSARRSAPADDFGLNDLALNDLGLNDLALNDSGLKNLGLMVIDALPSLGGTLWTA